MKPYPLVLHNEIRAILFRLRGREVRFAGLQLLTRKTKIVISRGGALSLGKHVLNDGHMTIMIDAGGNVVIGNRVYFNEDVMISCKGSVRIGDGCRFGPNVKIFDNNHKFDAVNGVSATHSIGAVEIGDACWIGANSVILKGAVIGKNCVVGAGCVVSGVIPPCSIVTQGREVKIEPMRAEK